MPDDVRSGEAGDEAAVAMLTASNQYGGLIPRRPLRYVRIAANGALLRDGTSVKVVKPTRLSH